MNMTGGVDTHHSVRVSSPSHRVVVRAEERPDIRVDGPARARRDGHQLTIDDVRGTLRLRVPLGTEVHIGTASSRVEVTGGTGATAVSTTSGRVEVRNAASLDVRTVSGRIEARDTAGDVCVRSESGKVEVRRCDDVDVSTKTGRIEVIGAEGEVSAHCVSGRIEIRMARAADVSAETVSGRVEVHLPPGTRPFRPAPGLEMASRPADADCTVTARSVTGRIEVSPS